MLFFKIYFFLTRSAPSDCLQYFTGTTGSMSSFNWKDVAGTATRQLANNRYKFCFRTELINQKVSSAISYPKFFDKFWLNFILLNI